MGADCVQAASPVFKPFPGVLAWMQRVASHLGPVHGEVNKVLDKVLQRQAQSQAAGQPKSQL